MRKLNKITPVLFLLAIVCQTALAQNKPDATSTKAAKTSALPSVIIGSTDKVSYVRSYDFYKALTSDGTLSTEITNGNVMQSTQYVDGLGRPIQSVARRALPGGYDMVQFSVYDEFGRQVYQPLPFQSNHNDGRLHLTPSTQQGTFMNGHYTDEDIFYGLAEYDNSPLGRVTKQMAPGNSWAGSGVGVTSTSRANVSGDAVRVWTLSTNPSTSSTYAVGALIVSITTDEEGNQVKQFTDKLGRVILKQVQKGSGSADGHNDWLNTYYVYDVYGNLSHVLPPRAVDLLSGSSWSWNTTDMDALVFKYTYDDRNRMITKKVPGAGIVEMVYDKLDRLVATRDANMTTQGKWLFTKYDDLNRPVMTGFVTSTNSRATMQFQADASGVFNVSTEPLDTYNVLEGHSISLSAHVSGTVKYRSKTTIEFLTGFDSNGEEFETEVDAAISSDYTFVQGYHDATFPMLKDYTHEVLSLSYFDNYDFTTQTYNLGYNDFYAEGVNNAVTPSEYTNVTGMATGSKVKVLGTADEWLTTVMFYDDRGRVIQTQADNHVGGRDIATTQYDFSGKVLNTYTVHDNPNATPAQTTIAKRYTYDGSGTGRLLTVQEKLNNASGNHKIIATNTYDELGQLKSKVYGNSLETLNYDYNIRGWLEGINEAYVASGTGGHYFGMDLSYDFGFDTNQLNGNIAGVKWRSASHSDQRAYGFEYDKVNRLTSADYSQGSGWINTTNDFSTNYTYDANGNILTLQREGVVAGSIETIDNLTYSYLNSNKSNQLAAVADAAGDLGQGDFKDGTNSGDDYVYDLNGNMTQDLNKDINGGDISYNHLNLPERIEFSNNASKTITYTYDAAGIKLKKTVNNNGQITTTDYVSGFTYENNQLQHFANEEGRVRKNKNNSLVYDYFVKDHLGNTRMTLTEDIDVTIYEATMETEYKDFEEQIFLNLPSTRVVSTLGDNTQDLTINSNEAAQLVGGQVGPAKMLVVSAGDQMDLVVQGRYSGTFSGSHNTSAMISAIASVFGGVNNSGSAESQAIYDLFNSNSGNVLIAGGEEYSNAPRAYMNYLFFDQNFELDSIKSGFKQISIGAATAHEILSQTLTFDEGGFLYVYLSNESASSLPVYFDQFQITHTKGAILQEDHYYPFGMNINALSSTAPLSKPNKYKFNGNEEQTEFDLNLFDFNARFYDPAVGRFISVDPLTDAPEQVALSPYQFSWNNPYNLNDPDGKCPFGCIGSIAAKVYGKAKGYSDISKPGREAGQRIFSNKSGDIPDFVGVDDNTRKIVKVTSIADDAQQVMESAEEVTKEVLTDFGEAATESGDALQKAGIVVSLVGLPEVGVPIATAGGYAESAGTVALATVDVANGDYKKALLRGLTLILDRRISGKINAALKKQGISEQAGAVIDANKEAIKEVVKEVTNDREDN
ncbi:DUF6443 domain-containing protein [Roseivirga sp. E12]|uniref:DUF6443 domain-containing protein n=1 Tax=Roseivirga sp. E12 TaxID=2819237 RepID=UPI001ABC8EA0|nr:DUF6443 domain-containing protein [Roseivirga sp. E12]MBO3699525.1 RHS repeat-associated core domain-containing protein [Roseivirga sp. E12]